MLTDLSKKIILGELDIGNLQSFWVNYSANTWYVDFDAVYDRIGAEFLTGVVAQSTVSVGSVSSDAAALLLAVSVATVEAQENTFFWDALARRVYIHLLGGDRPIMHRLVLGIVFGVGNADTLIPGAATIYWPHLRGAPKISKGRDPLFYGRLEYGGGSLSLENMDGTYDLLGETQDVFGNSLRLYLGCEGEARASFRQFYTGTTGRIGVGQALLDIKVSDPRRYLVAEIPDKVFTVAAYPDLKPGNEGKSIPIGYGELRNVPVICINEDEAPAPANYDFLLFDVSRHPAGITSIDIVYVDGVPKVPSASSALLATFSLAAADYDPGQKVTCTCVGYKDDAGNTISNALDIITDIFERWMSLPYSATGYDQAAWNAARAIAPDACYFADKPVKLNEIIEEICASVRGLFFSDRFGRWSFRIVNRAAYPVRTLQGYRMLEGASVDYDPEQTIGVVLVGYDRDWAEDDYKYLRDDSRQAEVKARYKIAPEHPPFDTLLTNAADAQAFATAVLEEGAFVSRPFSVHAPMSGTFSEVGDIVLAELTRADGSPFIGTVKAEVVGIDYDLLAAEETLSCLIIEVIPPMGEHEEAGYYAEDEMYYGDDTAGFYGESGAA